ncbi:MAG: thermonuclease family protein [Desulfobacula sp.]|nr:thermonuclease family protein [Desulfobacula sp.]
MIQVVLLSLSGLLFLSNIWFWTDDDGVRHYSNVTRPTDTQVRQIEESQQIYKKVTSKQNKKHQFTVIKVFDGDTVQVTGLDLKFTIRMVGIDTPEIGYDNRPGQPFGRKAKTKLIQLVENKKVTIKSYGTGGYNRQLAEIFFDGKNINLEMIASGMAEVYQGRFPKSLNSKTYFNAQANAKKKRKGIWVQGKSYKSPKQWRKEHPRK